MKSAILSLMFGIAAFGRNAAFAESPYKSSSDFSKYAEQMRESALLHLEPQVIVPTTSRPFTLGGGAYPWKRNIVTTIFWVGEPASGPRNPVSNRASSWDLNWEATFGGFDDPEPSHRTRNFIPANFIPRQNPFYVALPYNDVTHAATKPESKLWIPWFKNAFVKEGQSVCHDRWIEIRGGPKGRVCYAQWSDCGPFRTDHYQYVFGDERPKPNLNQGAGLDVSPAVRDYLQLAPIDVTDWRFVEFREIPKGPWALYGDNNSFVQLARGSLDRVVSATGPSAPLGGIRSIPHGQEEPTVIIK